MFALILLALTACGETPPPAPAEAPAPPVAEAPPAPAEAPALDVAAREELREAYAELRRIGAEVRCAQHRQEDDPRV